MFCESHFWIIFPLMFLGMMILCMKLSRRRGRRFCCYPTDDRHDYGNRIRKLEDEILRLKGR